MKPESPAWNRLYDRAEAQLRPGFAQRVLRAVEPSVLRQFTFSAAAATLCLMLGVMLHERITSAESARNLAAWRDIAAESEDIGQVP